MPNRCGSSAHGGTHVSMSISPRPELHLGESDEEQLFVRVSEPGQGPLWPVFPHPLLICLKSE